MFGFILGIAVGAAGYWAYRFWKGDDSNWDQSWGSGSSSLDSGYSSDAPGSSIGSGSTSTPIGSTAAGGPTAAEGARPTPE